MSTLVIEKSDDQIEEIKEKKENGGNIQKENDTKKTTNEIKELYEISHNLEENNDSQKIRKYNIEEFRLSESNNNNGKCGKCECLIF
jgi:hypothetical protein